MATQLKLPFKKRRTKITAKQKSARRKNIKIAQKARKRAHKAAKSDRTLNWLLKQPKGSYRGHQ